MHKNICFVAFNGTIASEVLTSLSQFKTYTIESNLESIHDFVTKADDIGTKYIIGLGQYSGRDTDKLRIETKCNKKFRNNEIANSQKLLLDEILSETDKAKKVCGLGNSFCNLLSVMILNDTNRKYLYAFIHIPKNFKATVATAEILKMLPQA